jgi:hypothetical protein
LQGNFAGNSTRQVITQSNTDNSRYLTTYDGSGGVTTTALATAPAAVKGFYAMDVDGDGLRSCLLNALGSAVFIATNITVPPCAVTFAAPVQVYVPTGSASIFGRLLKQMDFTGDGRADLLVLVTLSSGGYQWVPLLFNGVNSSGVIQSFTAMPAITEDCNAAKVGCTAAAVNLD